MTLTEQVTRILTGLKKRPTLLLEVKRQLANTHVLADWREHGVGWIRYEGDVGKAHVSRTQDGLWEGRAESTTVVGVFDTVEEAKHAVDEEMVRRGYFLAGEDPPLGPHLRAWGIGFVDKTVMERRDQRGNVVAEIRKNKEGLYWGEWKLPRLSDGPPIHQVMPPDASYFADAAGCAEAVDAALLDAGCCLD